MGKVNRGIGKAALCGMICASCCTLFSLGSESENILPNGDFEEALNTKTQSSCWHPMGQEDGITLERTDKTSYSGKYSIFIDAQKKGGLPRWISPALHIKAHPRLVPGKKYNLSFRMKTKNLNGAGALARVSINVFGKDKEGKNKRILFDIIGQLKKNSNWKYFSGNFKLPENADYLFIALHFLRGTGQVYLDDVQLMSAEEAAKRQVYDRTRFMFIPQIGQSPEIDGKLDESWTEIEPVELSLITGGEPEAKTKVRVGRDEKNIYLFFNCLEPHMDKMKIENLTGDEKNFFFDDTVELFIDPTPEKDDYLQFAVNPAGHKADIYSANPNDHQKEWQFKWDAAARREKDRWSVEMKIPFSEISKKAPDGTPWKINLNRTRQNSGKNEYNSWQILPVARYHQPGFFGQAVFSNPGVFISEISPRKMELRNIAGKAIKIHAKVTATLPNGKKENAFEKEIELPCRGESIALNYPLKQYGTYSLNCEISDKNAKSILKIKRSFEIPDLVKELKEVQKELAEISKKMSKKFPQIAQNADSLREKAGILEKQLERKAASDITDLMNYVSEVNRKFKIRSQTLQHQAELVLQDQSGAGYGMAVANSLTKLRCEPAYLLQQNISVDNKVKLQGARNEWESFQLILIPINKNLDGVRVAFENLKEKNGKAVIPASALSARQLAYVETSKPHYKVDYVGYWPDPLMENSPFKILKDRIEPLWISLHIPKSVPAGEYCGNITVKPSNAPERKMELSVKVFDFNVPEKLNYRSRVGFGFPVLGAFYFNDYGKKIPLDMAKDWVDLYLKYRLSPAKIGSMYTGRRMKRNFDNWDEQKEIIKYAIGKGQNVIDIDDSAMRGVFQNTGRRTFNEVEKKKLREQYGKIRDFMKENGWIKYCYFYGWDEPRNTDTLKSILEENKFLKSISPEFKLRLTKDISFIKEYLPENYEEFKEYIDVWAPCSDRCINENELKLLAEERKKGKDIWWYRNVLNIDWPALSQRNIMGMLSRKYGFNGYLSWASTSWGWISGKHKAHDNIKLGVPLSKKWPNIPWNPNVYGLTNGNAYLVYPGPNGKPWGSFRLEVIRDGIEDWEYLNMLEELNEKLKKKNPNHELVAETEEILRLPECYQMSYSFENKKENADKLLRDREKIARQIEKIRPLVSAKN